MKSTMTVQRRGSNPLLRPSEYGGFIDETATAHLGGLANGLVGAECESNGNGRRVRRALSSCAQPFFRTKEAALGCEPSRGGLRPANRLAGAQDRQLWQCRSENAGHLGPGPADAASRTIRRANEISFELLYRDASRFNPTQRSKLLVSGVRLELSRRWSDDAHFQRRS